MKRPSPESLPPRPAESPPLLSDDSEWCDEHNEPVIHDSGHCIEGVGCGSMTKSSTNLHLLVIEHKHGVNPTLHATHADAYAALGQWCREWWDEVAPNEAGLHQDYDLDDVIETYFDFEPYEHWSIEEVAMPEDNTNIVVSSQPPIDTRPVLELTRNDGRTRSWLTISVVELDEDGFGVRAHVLCHQTADVADSVMRRRFDEMVKLMGDNVQVGERAS